MNSMIYLFYPKNMKMLQKEATNDFIDEGFMYFKFM